jgi:universal stress protein E
MAYIAQGIDTALLPTGVSVNPIRKILVVVDPTAEFHPAVLKATILARKLNAAVELYVCETTARRERRLAASNKANTPAIDVPAWLESVAQPLRSQGLQVNTCVEVGQSLHTAILAHLRRGDADLLVKDTHHHSLARRTFLTNTDWQLIRGCPVPLLLVKPKPWAEVSDRMRVVVAVDPTHVNDKPPLFDNRLLEHAAAFRQLLQAELHIVHAYLPASFVAAGMDATVVATATEQELESLRVSRLRQVTELAREYDVPAANVHVELGSAVDQLPEAVSQLGAALIVMGAIARHAVERALLGSTAEDVLERLPSDVLVVKPLDFAELLPF